ncbi:MAG: hypothetical protein ACE5DI_05600 [Candidatus Micrarchaeia archaeon]
MGALVKIKTVKQPLNVEDEFEEFFKILGLLSERDTNQTVVRVFRVIVQNDTDEGLRSSTLAQLARLNRLTTMYHLNRLVEAGLLEKHQARYFFKKSALEQTVKEFEREAEESFARARRLATLMRRELE